MFVIKKGVYSIDVAKLEQLNDKFLLVKIKLKAAISLLYLGS